MRGILLAVMAVGMAAVAGCEQPADAACGGGGVVAANPVFSFSAPAVTHQQFAFVQAQPVQQFAQVQHVQQFAQVQAVAVPQVQRVRVVQRPALVRQRVRVRVQPIRRQRVVANVAVGY